MKSDKITITQIMAEIEKTAAEKKAGADVPEPGSDFEFNSNYYRKLRFKMYEDLHMLDIKGNSTAIRDIPAKRGMLRPVKTLFKRMIRKMVIWVIEPVCVQQTDYNKAVLMALSRQIEINDEIVRGMHALKEKTGSREY